LDKNKCPKMEIPKKSSKTHQKIDTTRVGPVLTEKKALTPT
jgi:hypothetical protein